MLPTPGGKPLAGPGTFRVGSRRSRGTGIPPEAGPTMAQSSSMAAQTAGSVRPWGCFIGSASSHSSPSAIVLPSPGWLRRAIRPPLGRLVGSLAEPMAAMGIGGARPSRLHGERPRPWGAAAMSLRPIRPRGPGCAPWGRSGSGIPFDRGASTAADRGGWGPDRPEPERRSDPGSGAALSSTPRSARLAADHPGGDPGA